MWWTDGIGVVARDSRGRCLASLARHFPQAQLALHMEAEGLRGGLLIAMHQQWEEIEIESDCALIVAAMQNRDKDILEVSPILQDCHRYIEMFKFVVFRHIYREANGVAHRLATLVRSPDIDEFWVGECPCIILDTLLDDGCDVNRGVGLMSPSSCTPLSNSNEINGRSYSSPSGCSKRHGSRSSVPISLSPSLSPIKILTCGISCQLIGINLTAVNLNVGDFLTFMSW